MGHVGAPCHCSQGVVTWFSCPYASLQVQETPTALCARGQGG